MQDPMEHKGISVENKEHFKKIEKLNMNVASVSCVSFLILVKLHRIGG
jgi:protein gp37